MTTDNQSRPVPRASAVEALTQIRALCNQIDGDISLQGSRDEGMVATEDVRAVLDAVPVDATPPQGIDREELLDHAVLIDRAVGSLAHIVPNETAAWNVWNYIASPGPVRDAILALARPVEGVTLSLEEIEWLRPVLRSMLAPHPAFVIEGLADKVSALAARLEARS